MFAPLDTNFPQTKYNSMGVGEKGVTEGGGEVGWGGVGWGETLGKSRQCSEILF